MILKDKLVGPTIALEEEPEPAFESKSAAELDNTDIQVDEQLRADRTKVAAVPIMVAQPDEIMYELELGAYKSDEGLDAPPIPPPIPDIAGYVTGIYAT